jgi:hypothetical protein
VDCEVGLEDLLQKLEDDSLRDGFTFESQCGTLPASVVDAWMEEAAATLKDSTSRTSSVCAPRAMPKIIRVSKCLFLQSRLVLSRPPCRESAKRDDGSHASCNRTFCTFA